MAASAADLPIDLVEEIFLCLDDAADLVRASAACASFRRLVSNGRFLRRFRSLHRRPVLGLLSSAGEEGFSFHPATPPRRTAPAARAVAGTAGLSSTASFLPAKPTDWHVHDARDGRVLLSPADFYTSFWLLSFSYLVVYDPLHCKHVQIPPIPKDIVACICSSLHQAAASCECQFDPLLVPAKDDEGDLLSFRVMCTVLSTDIECNFVLEIFIYSSVTGQWRGVTSLREAAYEPLHRLSSMERNYAHGCFYWVDYSFGTDMLELDMNEMKFSAVRLPLKTKCKFKIVVQQAAADDDDSRRIGLLVLCGGQQNHTLHLYTKAFGGANDCWQWRHDAEIALLDSYQWFFGGAAEQGYALLRGIPLDEYVAWNRSKFTKKRTPIRSAHYFTVELKTMVVEQLCVSEFNNEPAFLYASFPPPFALPCL